MKDGGEVKQIANPEVVAAIMPTASGFFFGGNDYDEWYMADIDDTIQIIEKLLSEDLADADIYYSHPGKYIFCCLNY